MEMKKNNNSVLRRLTKKRKKEIWQISIAENLHCFHQLVKEKIRKGKYSRDNNSASLDIM